MAVEYAGYRMREYLNEQLFNDKYMLTPSEMLHTIGVALQALIDSELYDKVLPLASLMEYIACDIVKSKVLTVKARIFKI